jgi:hypothetical protein
VGLLTLHVGSGKCGSTAIRGALTRHPVIPLAAGEATYVVVDRSGRVASGPEVAPGPLGRPRKSATMAELAALPPGRLEAVRSRLLATSRPVMSSEHWLGTPEPGREVLGRLGLAARIVAYVRPQVDYVNAAFWQWDAWDGTTREQWMRRRITRSRWHERVMRWRAIPEVERVTVRLLPGDVVTDFLGLLGAAPGAIPAQPRINQSLPGTLLRALQDRPALRAAHASELAWVLPELLEGADPAPAPWLLTPADVARIQSEQRAGNERLLDLLDEEDAARMRADRRWWDAEAYAGRAVEPMTLPPSARPGSDAPATRLLEAAIRRAAERAGRAGAAA